MLAILLAAQGLDPLLDLGLRPPRSEEVQAAERRARRQVPRIAAVCRDAVRSGNVDAHVRNFADRNGLSSYGRVTLLTHCLIYQQGRQDRPR